MHAVSVLQALALPTRQVTHVLFAATFIGAIRKGWHADKAEARLGPTDLSLPLRLDQQTPHHTATSSADHAILCCAHCHLCGGGGGGGEERWRAGAGEGDRT